MNLSRSEADTQKRPRRETQKRDEKKVQKADESNPDRKDSVPGHYLSDVMLKNVQ